MRCYNETLIITSTNNDVEYVNLFLMFNVICFFYLMLFNYFF